MNSTSRYTQAVEWLRATLSADAHLHTDSRAVQPGDGFLAFAVEGADNRGHIGDAIARGAKAVLLQPVDASAVAIDVGDVAVWPVPGLDVLAGDIASAWYGVPSEAMSVIGVTGTNGKTSCTQWIAAALAEQGTPTAVIGTLGVGMLDKLVPTGFTTPNAAQLQHCLSDLRHDGAQAVAMEVSSHALHQGRVNGTRFDIAVFTNLTQDHLDYHRTMAAYESAKARLFDWPGLRFAVVNRDDPAGARLLRHLDGNVPTFAYGIDAGERGGNKDGGDSDHDSASDSVRATYSLCARDVHATPSGGTAATIAIDGAFAAQASVELATLGLFNVANLLAVLGALLAMRLLHGAIIDAPAFEAAVDTLSRLQPVLGRMQRIGGRAQHDEPLVVIDYAHTPDALEKTLLALQPVAAARGGALTVMFGCGGDRDATKRPLMGAIARDLADTVVVTSDNPRSESPAAIIDQIAAGARRHDTSDTTGAADETGAADGADAAGAVADAGHVHDAQETHAANMAALRLIEDRAIAILQTIRAAKREDVVLLAGKGHEATQEIMGKKRPFSDQDHAQLALAARATHLRGDTE